MCGVRAQLAWRASLVYVVVGPAFGRLQHQVVVATQFADLLERERGVLLDGDAAPEPFEAMEALQQEAPQDIWVDFIFEYQYAEDEPRPDPAQKNTNIRKCVGELGHGNTMNLPSHDVFR